MKSRFGVRFYASPFFQIIAAVLLGIAAGCLFPRQVVLFQSLSDGFVKIMRLIITPIVFVTVAVGIGSVSDLGKAGRTGGKALVYFEVISTLSLFLGLIVMARVGEWFHHEILPSPIGGSKDEGWWQGWEMVWYNDSIKPLSPAAAGIPLYLHLNDSEFHMYRDTWDIYPGRPGDTYVYFRNSAHDGHNYWAEHYSGRGLAKKCIAVTSSHDGGDNGHFGIFRDNRWLAVNKTPDGPSNEHNCLTIDGVVQIMKGPGGERGYQVPALADTGCSGEVDSDYGHAIGAVIGPAYPKGTVKNYHRYFFVIRQPMYVLVVDEVEPGHEIAFNCYAEAGATKQTAGLYTSPHARYELLYPQSGFVSSSTAVPIVLKTRSPQLMFLAHPNPAGVAVSRSVRGGLMTATIGLDTMVYNPGGEAYSTRQISGDAKLFAERTGGALIFQATRAAGAQYGVNCESRVNLSVSGAKASIYVYGTGSSRVSVTSPSGTKIFDVTAGQTVKEAL